MEKAINIIHIIFGASNDNPKKMYAMMVPPIPVTPALTSAKIFDDISIRYSKPTAIVFLNSDRHILNVFPSANRADVVFFLDMKNQEQIGKLYQWLGSTATKG